LPSEEKNASLERLAGIFAAKEAVLKALELKAGSWKKIEVRKTKEGRPEVRLIGLDKNIKSQDISISHDGQYAVAVAIFLVHSA
jgi:phosphopantetheine--protein transferase-like protein